MYSISPCPNNVSAIIAGILANVDININLIELTGSKPAIYTNKSFGVPGNKKSIRKILSNFLGLLNHLLFSSFSIFSLLVKVYIKLLPNFLTEKNIKAVLKKAPN